MSSVVCRLWPALLGIWALLAAACSRPPREEWPPPFEPQRPEATAENALRQVAVVQIPPLVDPTLDEPRDRATLAQALEASAGWLRRRPADTTLTFGECSATASQTAEVIERVLAWVRAGLGPEALAVEVVNAFETLEAIGDEAEGEMLVTGYFEPVIDGSLTPDPAYPVPIYGPPRDRVRVDLGAFAEDLAGRRLVGQVRDGRLVPYPDRRQLRLEPPVGREIAWARDRVDLFFLEIQGSGTLRLPAGGEQRIGWAGSNGRPYRSIGRLLIDEGALEREIVSMQSIRAWLAEHPEERDRILDHNANVVFFRRLAGSPVGSLGVPVTAGRSIATDSRLFPRGALGFLVSEVPALDSEGRTVAEAPLLRFVLNQDTGGAIRGPHRVDYFWGRGKQAGERAGAMKQQGRLFFFAPKGSCPEEEELL